MMTSNSVSCCPGQPYKSLQGSLRTCNMPQHTVPDHNRPNFTSSLMPKISGRSSVQLNRPRPVTPLLAPITTHQEPVPRNRIVTFQHVSRQCRPSFYLVPNPAPAAPSMVRHRPPWTPHCLILGGGLFDPFPDAFDPMDCSANLTIVLQKCNTRCSTRRWEIIGKWARP